MSSAHAKDKFVLSASRWVVFAAIIVMAPRLALAEYKLQSGDVLDIIIAGIPDFRLHVEIGLEGNIAMPLAGRVSVGGLSLTEAQTRIAGALANKLYRQYASDGREITHLVLGDEVAVDVSECPARFTSVAMSSKPGAYPFRPVSQSGRRSPSPEGAYGDHAPRGRSRFAGG